MSAPFLIAVMGPTASGKTSLAESLADRLDAQLVNADAFQMVRGFDIGTAKPTARDRYALLDVLDPREESSVADWIRRAGPVLEECYAAGRSVILSGGTGFYIRALMEGYDAMAPAPDPALRQRLMEREANEGLTTLAEELAQQAPEVAARIDLKNPARVRRALERLASPPALPAPPLPAFLKVKFRLVMPTELLDLRIEQRVDAMFSDGWAEEVRTLIAQGVPKTAPAFRAIGYLSLIEWLEGQASREDTRAEVILRTRQYAKRQRTWLRSEPGAIDIPVDGSEAGYAEALHLMMGHLISVRG